MLMVIFMYKLYTSSCFLNISNMPRGYFLAVGQIFAAFSSPGSVFGTFFLSVDYAFFVRDVKLTH